MGLEAELYIQADLLPGELIFIQNYYKLIIINLAAQASRRLQILSSG
jgi:hypothetical protein